MTYKPSKLGRTDLVLVYDRSCSSVGLCMQDYKSLRLADVTCATVVNTRTDTKYVQLSN